MTNPVISGNSTFDGNITVTTGHTLTVAEGTDALTILGNAKINNTGSASNPNYDGLNLYGDEVSTNIKSVGLGLAAAGLIPASAVNLLPNYNVARTGYAEQDLNDNSVKSVKADFSLHFKPWANDNEIIFQHKIIQSFFIFIC